MLDAVRMCGRWIKRSILDFLSSQAQSSDPPSRRQLVRDFCRHTLWHNRKGQPCLSSANVCLNRLEKQGLVQLPPPAPSKRPLAKRSLHDDGLPLPPLPGKSAQLQNLRVSLISGPDDPQHKVWNRLISRQHPLKGAPLVGTQLRYLILAGENDVLGAIGFGPPAFYLSCRDCWIAWDAQAREQNRGLVIGLSRFLIRQGVSYPNLASRCYALVLARVREDWFQRYGLRPVLVETYVDRGSHTGKSLMAANWLRIGQSQGRGRSSPRKSDRLCNKKDVWIWQWDPQARSELQRRALPSVVPRSVFSSGQKGDWIQEELDGMDLGHVRLKQRFALMLRDRWTHPERSFFSSFQGKSGGKAAYAFVENPRAELQFANLLDSHWRSTRRRMAAERVVILAQDTSTLSYNTLKHTEGLGPVGDERHPGRGLFLHSLLAFRLDGIPLGAAWARLWARQESSDTAGRNSQSIDQKESVRWVDAFQRASQIAGQMPKTLLICCGDRENDLMDFYDRSTVAPANLFYLVRAQHDRILESGDNLRVHLAAQPLGGIMKVQIPRNKNRPARVAALELRWAKIRIQPPQAGCKKSWSAVELWALQAEEIDPPAGTQPIQWILLTNWKIDSLKTARRLIRWYGRRWGIECWHQVLKDVCRVETRQLKSAEALGRALAVDMIVAWRILLLCRLGKDHPHLPASVLYSPEELAVLEVYKKKASSVPPPPDAAPGQAAICQETLDLIGKEIAAYEEASAQAGAGSAALAGSLGEGKGQKGMSLWEANHLTAQLAGFWSRKSDGHPGPDVLGRGLLILGELVHYERIKKAQQLACPRNPRGKPG